VFLKPTFIGIRYAARELGVWHRKVEATLGNPDAIIRWGFRDQKSWLVQRINSILPKTNNPITLYSRIEALKVAGIGLKMSWKLLPDSSAVAFTPTFRGKLAPLFSEYQLRQLRIDIASKRIKFEKRYRRKMVPNWGCGSFPARHIWNSVDEDSRIAKARAETEFWAKLV
jgi:hypothetical protein